MELTLKTQKFNGNINKIITSAFQHEVNYLEIGIAKTMKKIHSFESKYNCTFTELKTQIAPLDYIDWEGEIKLLELLRNKQKALKMIKICS